MQASLETAQTLGAAAALARATDIQAQVLQQHIAPAASGLQAALVTTGARQSNCLNGQRQQGTLRAAQGMAAMAMLRVAAAEFPGTVPVPSHKQPVSEGGCCC